MMARKWRIVLTLALAVAGLPPGRSGAQPVEVDLELVIAVDISRDGPNNYGPPVTAARDAIVRQGIVINGLPILTIPSPIFTAMDLYYSDCVIGGPGAFVLPVTSVDGFAPAVRRKLIQEGAARPAAPAIIPVAARAPVDCLVGEEARKLYADPYLPGLDN